MESYPAVGLYLMWDNNINKRNSNIRSHQHTLAQFSLTCSIRHRFGSYMATEQPIGRGIAFNSYDRQLLLFSGLNLFGSSFLKETERR